jgi:hypothetical protein
VGLPGATAMHPARFFGYLTNKTSRWIKINMVAVERDIITINILLFLKVRDFRILCGKIS